MLSRPDFLQKQIIVIHSYQLRGLRFANENLIIEEDGKIIEQTSLHKVFSIFLIGEGTISTRLIRELRSYGILLILLRKNLELVEVIGDGVNGNTKLREVQYRHFTDPEYSGRLSSRIIGSKIMNQEALLRKIRESDTVRKNTALKLHTLGTLAINCQDPKRLLGIEGNAAKYFFHEYYREMDWIGRYPRTKIDPNNVLLDMGYTFLFHFIEGLLSMYGFDLYEGIYHRRFYERKSLVCDIEEPFRCIIDEAVRKAHNLGQISQKDFGYTNGAYFLQGETIQKYSRIFARAILDHKEDMYRYVYEFYRYLLDESRDFPVYCIYGATYVNRVYTDESREAQRQEEDRAMDEQAED